MKKFTVKNYDLRDKNGSGPERQPLRFAFLTDLHSVCIGENNGTLLAAVRRAEPDAVLCGGDMIVGKPGQTPETALALLRRLREEYPVIHALGNHEYRAKIYPEIYGKLYRFMDGKLPCTGSAFPGSIISALPEEICRCRR